ncbi:ras-related protein Rab-22A-like [Diadema antillarum]|uniref:ras-related protein Rab-22A-like n=1 Tax=Diadema antillarum TaxID=105358 RepID=UPI003A84A039
MLAQTGPVAYGIAAENMAHCDVKVCLLGKHCVGKTSITNRFLKGTFDEKYETTIGAAFTCKCLLYHNVEYRFLLWDTAGQERFRALSALTYKNAAAAVLVYDITDQTSFDDVSYWLKELRRQGPEEILVYIVGNKIDLESSREVDRDMAEQYAQRNGAFHLQSSAKTGSGVIDIFYEICAMLTTFSQMKRDEYLVSRTRGAVVLDASTLNSGQDQHDMTRRCLCRNT